MKPRPEELPVTMIGALPPWRGVAPYTRHLVAALASRNELAVEFLDFSSLYPPRLYPGGAPNDPHGIRPAFDRVRVRRLLAWYNPLSWLWAGLTLRGRVVHAQWWSYVLAPVYLAVLALAKLRGRRVLLTLHNVAPHEEGRWRRWLNRAVLMLGDRFIVHSARNAEELVASYPKVDGRVSVVPHGLLTVARPRVRAKEEARRALDLDDEIAVVLAFGNIRPYKGVDVLLRALRSMLDAGREATLVIVGQPWGSFEPYRRLIDELSLGDHVRTWLGFAPDDEVASFFEAADLAVFPYTHFDAQSGAASLALSFRLPVVVSEVGGLPDVVSDARAIVPPGDPEALAGAISAVLSDEPLRAKLAADSERKAAELDWGSIARETARIYTELVSAEAAEEGTWERAA